MVFFDLIVDRGVEALPSMILTTACGASAVALLGILVLWSQRRRSAARRQWLAYGAGLLIFGAPVASVWLPGAGWGWLPAAATLTPSYDSVGESQVVASSEVLEDPDSKFLSTGKGAALAALRNGEATDSGSFATGGEEGALLDSNRSDAELSEEFRAVVWFSVAALWALGTLLSLVWLGLGLGHLRRRQRAWRSTTDPRLSSILAAEAEALGVTPPALRLGSPVPVTIGWRRPILALPPDAAELSEQDLRGILIHELAHLRSRHPVVRLVQAVVLSMHWWNPLVHVLDRGLRACQEEVCDQAVVRRLGDGVGFARCLVAFAERTLGAARLPLASALIYSGGALETRVSNLLNQEKGKMDKMGWSGVLVCVMFTAIAAAAQAGLAPASDSAEAPIKVGPTAPAYYLPLTTGARWVWEVENGKDPKQKYENQLQCVRPVSTPTGGWAWELRATYHKVKRWEYWSSEKDGIVRHKVRGMGRSRGISRHADAACLVPGPIGAQTKWQWVEYGSVQTMGGSPPDRETLRRDFTGKILSMAEKITVPAGTFSAMKIEIKSTSPYFGDSAETLWFAPRTGMVQRVVHGRTYRSTSRLKSFTPGDSTAKTPVPEQLRRALAADPAVAAAGAPTSIEPLWHSGQSHRVLSEFYRAKWRGRALVWIRQLGQRAVVFDPSRAADWDLLVKDERIARDPKSLAEVAKVMGFLTALEQDPKTYVISPVGTKIEPRDDQQAVNFVEITVPILVVRNKKRSRGTAWFRVVNQRIVKVRTEGLKNLRPSAAPGSPASRR